MRLRTGHRRAKQQRTSVKKLLCEDQFATKGRKEALKIRRKIWKVLCS